MFLKFCIVKGNQKINKQPQFDVFNSKNKDLAQQCTFQKVWKILLSLFPSNIETNEATNTIIALVSVGILNKVKKM